MGSPAPPSSMSHTKVALTPCLALCLFLGCIPAGAEAAKGPRKEKAMPGKKVVQPSPEAKAKPRGKGAGGVTAAAEAEPVCEAAGSPGCRSDSDAAGAAAFRILRRFIGSTGQFSRKLLETRALPDDEGDGQRFGLFLRKSVKTREVLMEVPLSQVLWRETLDLPLLGVDLPANSLLSEAERLVLGLAALRRAQEESRGADAESHFSMYGEFLRSAPVPNSTVFWTVSELAWLKDTDAGELTEHFLSRIAHIHSVVPLVADLVELKAAFAQYQSRYFRLWMGGSSLFPKRVEVALLPGIDLCRHREGALRPAFDRARRVVQLQAVGPMGAGEEIFVDFGARDITEVLVGSGTLATSKAGIFLPVPLDSDVNGGAKVRLIEGLRWPAEVRLFTEEEVQELRVLRLAAMPREEFSAWSVGALIAGAPLAVSRAFRTEVQANAYLVTECARRHAVAGRTKLPMTATSEKGMLRLAVVLRYREVLALTYERCQKRARDKLAKLGKWSLKQAPWVATFVEEARGRAAKNQDATFEKLGKELPLLSTEPPTHVNPEDLDQRLAFSSVVALVNSKAREFADYFSELLKAPVVHVPGFSDIGHRLQKIKHLAFAMVQLKGPACGNVDLSAFNWINELRGEEEVFTTLQYLLPEMDDLVREFLELEQSGEMPLWR